MKYFPGQQFLQLAIGENLRCVFVMNIIYNPYQFTVTNLTFKQQASNFSHKFEKLKSLRRGIRKIFVFRSILTLDFKSSESYYCRFFENIISELKSN